MKSVEWQTIAKNIVKSEMVKKDIDYEKLQQALSDIGVDKTILNIRTTINRGTFSTVFFLQCTQALGIRKLYLEEYFN